MSDDKTDKKPDLRADPDEARMKLGRKQVFRKFVRLAKAYGFRVVLQRDHGVFGEAAQWGQSAGAAQLYEGKVLVIRAPQSVPSMESLAWAIHELAHGLYGAYPDSVQEGFDWVFWESVLAKQVGILGSWWNHILDTEERRMLTQMARTGQVPEEAQYTDLQPWYKMSSTTVGALIPLPFYSTAI